MSTPARGWDLPIRAFHWSLATLVTSSFVTGFLGGSWLEWHMKSGYGIITLLLFRVAWGIAGSRDARFVSFVRGPRAARAYARALLAGKRSVDPGHNPLGGWMVSAMLALLALQAATGLFSNDESSNEGPLASKVSDAMVDRMSTIHSWNRWVILAAVAIHVIAVSVYQWRLRMDVVGPMIHGSSKASENVLALTIAAIAAAAVYWLVAVYPR